MAGKDWPSYSIGSQELLDLREKLESDPWGDETQRVYSVCQISQRHTYDQYDPKGGWGIHARDRSGGRIRTVWRLLTCQICTTRKLLTLWYTPTKSSDANRWDFVRLPEYDWPEGYLADEEHVRPERAERVVALYEELPVVER